MISRKLFPCLLSLLAIMLLTPACSRQEGADAGDLLATVPSDASSVAVANLTTLLEKAGCKIDNSDIKPGPEALAAVEKFKDEKSRRLARLFLSGKSGIQPSVTIFFSEGEALYNLGFLADPAKFQNAVSEEWGGSFADRDGIALNGSVAVKGNLYWVRMDGRDIEPVDINRFTTLSERQSILSSSLSDPLVRIENDVEGWGNIAGLLNASSLDFSSRGMTTMAIQTLLDDPSDVTFSVDFEKGVAKASAKILNSKGKPSKLLIPSGTIDTKILASIPASGDFMFAAALPQKLIKSLSKEIDGKGPSMLAILLKAISPLDGTTGVVGTYNPSALQGVISTTGENLVSLTELLNQADLKVTRDGNLLRIANGTPSGAISPEKSAADFKGAMVGILFSGSGPDAKGKENNFPQTGAVMLQPDDGSISINISANSGDSDTNFLLSLLRNLK